MKKVTAFDSLGKGLQELFKAVGPVAGAGKDVGSGAARGTGGLAVGTANTAAGVAGGVLGTIGRVAQHYPKLTFLAATYLGIKGIQKVVRNKSNNNQPGQSPMGGMPAPAFAPQAPAANPYMAPQQDSQAMAFASEIMRAIPPEQIQSTIQAMMQLVGLKGVQQGQPEPAPAFTGAPGGAPAGPTESFANRVGSEQPAKGGQGVG